MSAFELFLNEFYLFNLGNLHYSVDPELLPLSKEYYLYYY